MTIGNPFRETNIVWIAIVALLLAPAGARANRLVASNLRAANSLQDSQEAQDKEQEKRDREQEARDREEEKRDREQEARDRAQEKVERLQELYDDGREALDEDRYDQAEAKFKLLADMSGDPQKGISILENILNGSGTPKLKSRALFMAAQSGRPEAREILGKIARGQSNPELQRKAVEYLGLFGGAEARKTLADVYASSGDASVKHAILRSYMIGGDHERLFAAAKSEKDESLRREAIRQLGLVHGSSELEQLYQAETSPDLRREILQAFFLAGDSGRLLQAAQGVKDAELRRAAIRNLGLIHSDDSGKALQEIYGKEPDHAVKAEVLNAYFLQGNARALVAIARSEKDPELKKTAVSKLTLMHSKEGTDYLMELLQK